MYSFNLINSMIEKIQKNKIGEITDDDNNQLDFLLKSISNGKIEQINFDKINISVSKDIYRGFNDFIKKFFSLNDLNKDDLEPVFEKNKIINNKSYESGIYKAVYIKKDISLISIYKELTCNLPLTNTVLICNELTSFETIKAFIFLSCFCELNILFALIGIEQLAEKNRNEVWDLIKKFKEKEKEMSSILVILYSTKENTIKNIMEKIIPNDVILYQDVKNFEKIDDNDVEIFKSKYTGYGKTREFFGRISKEKKEKIYFPIGGDFTRKEILDRIFNLKLSNLKNCIFYFDLGETKNKELLRSLLFEILYLKKLEYNCKIIYFGKLKIFIEIPNWYNDYLEDFKLLKQFKINNIENLPPIKFKENSKIIKDCDFKIVANFLKAYDNGILIKENINLDEENKLTDEDSIKLFEKYLNFSQNKYNYYQINSYIKYLSTQFKAFNELKILKKEKLEGEIKAKYEVNQEKLDDIRKIIIKDIIKSIYILQTPYEQLVNSQNESLKENNIESPNQQAIKSLEYLNDKIDSSDNSRVSLIIFCEDDSTFRLFSKNAKDGEGYSNIYNFFALRLKLI